MMEDFTVLTSTAESLSPHSAEGATVTEISYLPDIAKKLSPLICELHLHNINAFYTRASEKHTAFVTVLRF